MATVAAASGAPASLSTAPTATLPAGVAKRAIRTGRAYPAPRPAPAAERVRTPVGNPAAAGCSWLATIGAMTMQASGRGPLVMLGSLAVLLALAGLLPWLAGGSGAAKAFGTPLLLVG